MSHLATCILIATVLGWAQRTNLLFDLAGEEYIHFTIYKLKSPPFLCRARIQDW